MIPIPENIKGLIFDCDGTLVDSMPLHMEAWEFAMNKFNAVFDYNFFFDLKGMPAQNIIDLYNQKFAATLDTEIVVNVKHKYFAQHISSMKIIEPVVEVVEQYKNILPMAVASGSLKEFVHAQLKVVGLFSHFQIILTADDPIRPKPAPDIFLEAAKQLHVNAKDCLVFEDGDPGIIGAHATGMKIIDVRDFL
jgi:HAD superfamily hydrolase (TIGR01509 family)